MSLILPLSSNDRSIPLSDYFFLSPNLDNLFKSRTTLLRLLIKVLANIDHRLYLSFMYPNVEMFFVLLLFPTRLSHFVPRKLA